MTDTEEVQKILDEYVVWSEHTRMWEICDEKLRPLTIDLVALIKQERNNKKEYVWASIVIKPNDIHLIGEIVRAGDFPENQNHEFMVEDVGSKYVICNMLKVWDMNRPWFIRREVKRS